MSNRNHPISLPETEPCEPHFAARLFPHRSLTSSGFSMLMAFLGAVCVMSAMLFMKLGAWPVVGFFGVDIALVWFAFRANYRAARAFEEVAVWPHDLLVRKVSANGMIREHRFNPFFARFRIDRHAEYGITRMSLAGEGREIDIGAFLNPPDRESFAHAFSDALARARRG